MSRINQIIITPEHTLASLMKRIDKTGFDFYMITDPEKKLLGVITEGDIRRGLIRGAALFDKVTEVMNKKPVTVKKGEDEKNLFLLFKTKNVVGKIPVIDDKGRVIDLAMELQNRIITYNELEKPQSRNGKVLVIGGAGYIGSVLVRKLLKRGYEVRVLDALLYEDESIKELYNNPRFEFIKGDTRNITDLTNSMMGITAVIHLAELVGDPLCAQDAKITKDINLFATSLIGQIAKQYLINRLIYASSASVYGANRDEKLLDEKSPLEPLSIYAKTKLASEQSLLLLADDVFAPCILRLSTVYGMSHRPRFDLVVNTLTANAYFKGRITIHGGNQWRPLVHVSDVGEAIIKVLEAPINKVRAQIFNVGSEEQNQQIISIAKKVKQQLPRTEVMVMKTLTDPRDYKVNFSKIRNVIGYRSKKSISEGIRELIKSFDSKKITNPEDKKYRNT